MVLASIFYRLIDSVSNVVNITPAVLIKTFNYCMPGASSRGNGCCYLYTRGAVVLGKVHCGLAVVWIGKLKALEQSPRPWRIICTDFAGNDQVDFLTLRAPVMHTLRIHGV